MDNNKNYEDFWNEIESLTTPIKKKSDYKICTNCNLDMFEDFSTGSYICKSCGNCNNTVFVAFDNMNYSTFKRRTLYKRTNKFRLKLEEIQGNLSTPEYVLDILRKYKLKTIFNVREALKRNKLTRYNINSYSILRELHGIRLFTLSRSEVDLLMSDFKNANQLFISRVGRRNMFNYNLIVGKILKARGYNIKRKIVGYKSYDTLEKNELLWDKMHE